ncbi:hypothetical protein Tco_0636318 [Tanacetum coccineum]
MTGLELQLSTLKKQVSRLNDKLATSDASFAKSKAKGKEMKKNIKSLGKSLDNLHAEVVCLSAALNQATILEAERGEEILRLKTTPLEFSSFFRGQFQGLVQKFLASNGFSKVQGELPSLAASVGFERGLRMHQTKDEFAAISKYVVEPLLVILQLEPEKLVCSFMLCDLDFEPLSLSLSSMPSCDLISLTNMLILLHYLESFKSELAEVFVFKS